MKGVVVALGQRAGRQVAALAVDGQLSDLFVEPDDLRCAPGAIHRAVVERPLKGQGGALVRLGNDTTGYLRNAKGLHAGQVLTVMVSTHAEAGKAVPVSTRVLLKERYAIMTLDAPGYNVSRQIRDEERREALLALVHEALGAPQDDVGVIIRSQAVQANIDDVFNELTALYGVARAIANETGDQPELLLNGPSAYELAWRDWPQADSWIEAKDALTTAQLDDAIDALFDARVDLAGQGYLYVEPTRALVAVDVNTAGDTSLAAGLKANIAMARLLPQVLRCRGLGGQITLDVAPMPKKDRRQFEQVLRAAFRKDTTETVLAGWTPLGLFELQRKRDRLPLPRDIVTR